MTDVTLKQFAIDRNISIKLLIDELQQAGVLSKDKPVDPETQTISNKQIQQFLDYRNKQTAGQKITLKRKRVEAVKVGAKTISVEVRKKRTYMPKKAEPEVEEAIEEPVVTTPEPQAASEPVVQEAAKAAPAEEAAKPKTTREKPEAKKRGNERPSDRHDRERGGGRPVIRDEEYRDGEMVAPRRRRKRKPEKVSSSASQHGFAKPTAPMVHEVKIPETISVADLAQKMAVKATEVIKVMMGMGAMVTINQVIDQDTAAIVVEEMGHTPVMLKGTGLEEVLAEGFKNVSSGEAISRPPVVTIMGHVDHGKTSLLDYIRTTRVTAGEAGGITQHIGAYSVATEKGRITFLDTPGHAAFTAMRARGANCTDIVVLVVAADDGVMPQTIEAIQHARAANVPIIVAVNKMDKPSADPDRVRTELGQYGIIPEDWGGENIFVYVSAKKGDGIDTLLDSILVQAEVLELTAVEDAPAKGVVLESHLDKGRGAVADLLVQQGTLKKGDIALVGMQYGRIRAMFDENGKLKETATASTPVEILGLSGTPSAGDEFIILNDERKAKEVALFRQGKFKEVKFAKQKAASLEGIFTQMSREEVPILNIVLKADVQGSAEAICDALIKLSTNDVKVKIVGQGVGGINETDVTLAMASRALLIGFNVRADAKAKRIAEDEGVEIYYFSVIYDVIDLVKNGLSGLLLPEIKEQIVGLAEVRDVFRATKYGSVAGCMVIEGSIKRHLPVRVLRNNVVIFEGEIDSLRRFKDDVNEVRHGIECGIGVKNYNDIKPGDHIEVYEKISVARKL
ncbi:MAG: translation initiation factor IF-2 [Gammaproteobacteria bacterium]|jgi:translation initiation factor IF-2